ncbi:MAG: SRPBCC family protein [Flavobacteriales bacterium]
MHVKESITIDAPASSVYKMVATPSTWEKWGFWQLQDTNMVHEYSGPEMGLGAKNSWKSATQGNGSQEIVEATENEHIKYELFFADWDDTSYSEWFFETVDGQTTATWTMDQMDIGFFPRTMMSIMGMEEKVKSSFSAGLKNLKKAVEAQPKFTPEMAKTADMWYIGLKKSGVSVADLEEGAMHGMAYGQIGAVLAEGATAMAGPPMCIVHSYVDGMMDLEFAMPVADSVAVPEGLVMGMIPGGNVIQKMHLGPYETSDSTWEAISLYVENSKAEVRYSPYEIYTNDPTTVKPEEIETLIVYPVN